MKLLINSNGGTGMWYHRLQVPFKALGESNGVQVDLVSDDPQTGTNGVLSLSKEQLGTYDAVIFSRVISEREETLLTAAHVHQSGSKVVVDIDDYWHIEPTHKLHQGYKKAEIPKKTELSLKVADLVFTPTPYLTEVVRKYSNNAHTIKTAINASELQWQSSSIESSLMRFGWIGGVHHYGDIKLLEKSFKKVHQNLEGYQLCLGGFNYSERKVFQNGREYTQKLSEEYLDIEKVFTSNYQCTDPYYKEYLHQYTSMADHISYFKNYRRLWAKDLDNYGSLYDEIDVSLVPLANTGKFNQYKSELKLIEAGTKGKMAIVSRVKPYTLVPEDCVHFIDPSDINGWYKAIKYCLDNPGYVKEKSLALKQYIRDNYDLGKENEKRFDLIKRLCA